MNARTKTELPTAEEWRAAVGEAARDLATVEPEPEIEESPADRVARMLNESHEDARAVVKLYQTLPGNKRAWCNDYPIAEFEQGGLDMIRRDWGPGDYTLTVYGTTPGKSNITLRAREMVTIRATRGETTFSGPLQRQNSELSEVMKSIAENQAKMMDAIINRPVPPPVDPMAQMAQMLQMMTLMRQATGADQAQPKSNIKEIIEAMREMREVSQEFGEQKEPESLLGVLPQALELIRSGMQQKNNAPDVPLIPAMPPVRMPPSIAGSAPAVQAVAQPSPETSPQPSAEARAQQEQANIMLAELKTLFAEVIAAEKATESSMVDHEGNPVSNLDFAAGLIYEKIPDEMLDVLYAPNWLEALATFIADAKQHEAWLTSVRNRVIEYFEEEKHSADESEAAAEGQETPSLPSIDFTDTERSKLP